MIATLAVTAISVMRDAEVRCAAFTRPLELVIEREPRWANGVRAHFDADQPYVIHLDPREHRVRLVVRHEVEHACRFAAGRADWAMGEPVY